MGRRGGPGDIPAFASRLTAILQLEKDRYEQLADRCVEIASRFTWSRVAPQTVDVYAERLERARNGGSAGG
jgi:glycosyltransferase involved in cell wall biosynthesis